VRDPEDVAAFSSLVARQYESDMLHAGFGEPSEAEARSRALWKTFHRTVAIENRINPALQRQFMPARYWKHLTEMDG
jgi:probable DNA metabolism protein